MNAISLKSLISAWTDWEHPHTHTQEKEKKRKMKSVRWLYSSTGYGSWWQWKWEWQGKHFSPSLKERSDKWPPGWRWVPCACWCPPQLGEEKEDQLVTVHPNWRTPPQTLTSSYYDPYLGSNSIYLFEIAFNWACLKCQMGGVGFVLLGLLVPLHQTSSVERSLSIWKQKLFEPRSTLNLV